jgi:hypothetical protein
VVDSGDTVPFDQPRLRDVLATIVAGRGAMHWWESSGGRGSGLLVPPEDGPGTPIYVTVVADEAVLVAGLGAQIFLSCGQAGDEKHVGEVVAAIMDGGATQYVFIDISPTMPLQARLAVEGAFGEYTFDVENAVAIGRLPAWPGSAGG